MYELNGKQYTLEQIEAILNKEKYKGSADDFIAERGYTKVSQPKDIEEVLKVALTKPFKRVDWVEGQMQQLGTDYLKPSFD